jgi:hypothetical protein
MRLGSTLVDLLSRLAPVLTLLLCASLAAGGRSAASAVYPPPPEVTFDVPPFPAEVARPFSFGLRSLVADLTFLQAIQAHALRKGSNSYAEGVSQDRQLARLLTYSVDLDPQFRGAYRFTGNALIRHTSDGKAAGVFAAESILKRGVVNRPDDWRIHFALGFIQTFYLDKRAEAASHFEAAARLPGAPAYLSLLATRLLADAGNLSTAEELARAMASQATEEQSRKEWDDRLLDLIMERHLRAIDQAAAQFARDAGRPPRTVEELVAARLLPAVPEEPRGGRYEIDAGGAARSTVRERLRFHLNSHNQSGLVPQ